MSQSEPLSLESAIRNGTVNTYMAALLLEPHLLTGDTVRVPKDCLRNFIRETKEQLRGRVGVVAGFERALGYKVEFAAVDGKPAFERYFSLGNLEKVPFV